MTVVIRRVVSLVAGIATALLATASASAQQRGLEPRVETLEAESAAVREILIAQRNRIAALEAAQRSQSVDVNCGAGQSVNAVLARFAAQAAPLSIYVSGICIEAVTIRRDNVTLQGVTGDDGIQAPSAQAAAVSVTGRGVRVTSMTLQGGRGLTAVGAGTSLIADNVSVAGAETALNVTVEASLSVSDCVVENNQAGALVGRGGTLVVQNTTFRNNGMGISAPSGRLRLSGSNLIEGNGSSVFGIRASQGAAVGLFGTTIRNHVFGVHLSGGSVASLASGTIIENNTVGIDAAGGSRVELGWATIRNNAGDGVRLGDVSTIAGLENPVPAPPAITANGGWGLLCAPAPAVAQITAAPGGYSLNGAHAFGNASGQIKCPGIMLP